MTSSPGPRRPSVPVATVDPRRRPTSVCLRPAGAGVDSSGADLTRRTNIELSNFVQTLCPVLYDYMTDGYSSTVYSLLCIYCKYDHIHRMRSDVSLCLCVTHGYIPLGRYILMRITQNKQFDL